jgi:hypothetical protein
MATCMMWICKWSGTKLIACFRSYKKCEKRKSIQIRHVSVIWVVDTEKEIYMNSKKYEANGYMHYVDLQMIKH